MELFTRLTFNENNWTVPSGHPWKIKYQGNKGIPYENQYGFGHEEWLFNTRYLINNYQYGYSRGFGRFHIENNKVDVVHFYTVKKENAKRNVYYLGYIQNLELLEDLCNQDPEILATFNMYKSETLIEVEMCGADKKGLITNPYLPVFRFKLNESFLLDQPFYMPNFPLSRYKRFQPYVLTKEIKNLFANTSLFKENTPFVFKCGKATQKQRFTQLRVNGKTEVFKMHSKIVDELEEFLKPKYSLGKENISIEKSRFCGNIADVVTLEGENVISIFEVKTSVIARRNLREAVGQLLDYASHCKPNRVKTLFIVSPCKLSNESGIFLKSLQKTISFQLKYIEYTCINDPKFIIYE